MTQDVKKLFLSRRSRYSISGQSPISDKEIQDIIEFTLTHVPSAFNSQSTRIVLLLGENHKRLWEIVKDELRKVVPEKSFHSTEAKINGAFKAGYGSILFFEDTETVEHLQEQFPLYKDNFPLWSQHTAGMHQFAIWSLLSNAGLGASLQHYNPLIDEAVAKEWNLSSKWKLIAQMPFGQPIEEPGEKDAIPLAKRFFVFK